MSIGFPRKKLTDVVFFQEGPGLRKWQWTDTGMKVINVTNLLGNEAYTVDTTNTDKYISLVEFEAKYKHFEVNNGDLVVASSDNTYGKVGRITERNLPLMMNTSVIRFRSIEQSELDDRYLFCFLRSNDFRGQVDSFVTGGAQPNFGPTHLKKMDIPVPEISIQKKIGSIIVAYDDLIENNRRRIQLLEESARLLYKEWFVQLRFPGHEHVKIVDGVPEGWAHLTVGTLLGKIKRKGKVKKDDYKADGVLACVDQSKEFIGGYIDSTELAIVDELPILVFGDHTRVVKYIDFPFAPGADGTQLLIPKSNEIPRVFFYFLIAGINLANAFYARHFKFLKATEVLVPKKELMRLFEDSVSTNMNQISLLREQNKKLSKARDILLPRLMNGTVTV